MESWSQPSAFCPYMLANCFQSVGVEYVHKCSYQLYPCPSPYPGNSWVLGGLAQDLQNIVSPQTRDLPWAYAGRYFLQKGQKFTTPGCSHMPGLWLSARGYGAGTYLGIYKENVHPTTPPQSRTLGSIPGLYLGHHKVQNWIPWQVPAISG